MRCGCCRHLLDHLPCGVLGAGDHAGNERSLGKVAPVFLRHLGLHRLHLEPRRVEDRAEIGAPQVLGAVIGRRVGLRRSRSDGQALAVPVGRGVGRQDRPAHAGEAAHEEGRVALDDEMIRLEPGDVALRPFRADPPEAHEGAHLVGVAAHRLFHRLEAPDVRVGGDLHQVGFGDDPQQHAIEKGEALGIAVADHRFGPRDELARHRQRRRRRGIVQPGRRCVRRPADAPFDLAARYALRRQPARGAPPAVEIGRPVERHAETGEGERLLHGQNSDSCCGARRGAGADASRRSARPATSPRPR